MSNRMIALFSFIGNSDLLRHKEKHMFTEHLLSPGGAGENGVIMALILK